MYKRKGIPYNIGICCHGDPGCGKTSFVKALSKHLNRHVVQINLKKIKTCTEFERIFNDVMMNDDYVPHEKKIICMEDIDCMIDIVRSREEENAKKNPNNENGNVSENKEVDLLSLLLKAADTTNSQIKDSIKDSTNEYNDALTLSCILNTIDGVLENYGRILIITTNYIDVLDKALIRPGRVDIKIKFTKCTTKMYYDIIENFFDTRLTPGIPFIDLEYSPAECLEICSMYNDSIDDAIKSLTLKKDLGQ